MPQRGVNLCCPEPCGPHVVRCGQSSCLRGPELMSPFLTLWECSLCSLGRKSFFILTTENLGFLSVLIGSWRSCGGRPPRWPPQSSEMRIPLLVFCCCDDYGLCLLRPGHKRHWDLALFSLVSLAPGKLGPGCETFKQCFGELSVARSRGLLPAAVCHPDE